MPANPTREASERCACPKCGNDEAIRLVRREIEEDFLGDSPPRHLSVWRCPSCDYTWTTPTADNEEVRG